MARCALNVATTLLMTGLVIGGAGCAPMTIAPPPNPVDPVTVHVADYGRHASLVLPDGEGLYVEYSYGEYAWYAQARNGWYRVVAVMLWPTQGTLGKRELFASDTEELHRLLGAIEVFDLVVDRTRVASLEARLAARHDSGLETVLYQPLYRMHFVVDPDDYCLWHQCNTVIARWLEELDCEVSGSRLYASFRVRARTGDGNP